MTEIVQSIERALTILEVVAEHNNGLGITEISNIIDLHKSTIHRILSTLIYKGYIIQDPTTLKYRTTLKLYELGYKRVANTDLLTASKPYTKMLKEFTNEVVHLVVRDGNEIVYIDKVEAENTITMLSTIGRRNPLYCTSVGKAILSYLDMEELVKIWKSSKIIKKTPNTITNLEYMVEELKQIKDLGYAVDEEEDEIGIRCVGSAILNKNGEVEGAVSISGPTMRITKDLVNIYGEQVKNCALQISKELGYIPK